MHFKFAGFHPTHKLTVNALRHERVVMQGIVLLAVQMLQSISLCIKAENRFSLHRPLELAFLDLITD